MTICMKTKFMSERYFGNITAKLLCHFSFTVMFFQIIQILQITS